MRKSILMIAAVVMLMGCGGKKAQTESVDAVIAHGFSCRCSREIL